MTAVIYNCKRCKRGRRVEYPLGSSGSGAFRIDAMGNRIPACIYVQSCGGGHPTVYGGDVENGICSGCGRMMSYGALKAFTNPDHKCDARCEGARGPNCDCSCGGANHGKAA